MKVPERVVFMKLRQRAGSDKIDIDMRVNVRMEEAAEIAKLLQPSAEGIHRFKIRSLPKR